MGLLIFLSFYSEKVIVLFKYKAFQVVHWYFLALAPPWQCPVFCLVVNSKTNLWDLLSLCTYLDISSLCKFMGFFLVLLCVRFRLVSNESYRFIGIKNEQSALFL